MNNEINENIKPIEQEEIKTRIKYVTRNNIFTITKGEEWSLSVVVNNILSEDSKFLEETVIPDLKEDLRVINRFQKEYPREGGIKIINLYEKTFKLVQDKIDNLKKNL